MGPAFRRFSVSIPPPNTDAAMDEGAAAPDDPEWCHPPRLLICRPDGSGAELWRHADVRSFLHARGKGVEEGVAQEQQLPFPADPDATVHTYVWRDVWGPLLEGVFSSQRFLSL